MSVTNSSFRFARTKKGVLQQNQALLTYLTTEPVMEDTLKENTLAHEH